MSKSTLPLYTGDHVRCVMCHNIGAVTRYRGEGEGTSFGTDKHRRLRSEFESPILPARLERVCNRCGYTWDEDTADHAGATAEADWPQQHGEGTDLAALLGLLERFGLLDSIEHEQSCGDPTKYMVTLTGANGDIDGESDLYAMFTFRTGSEAFDGVGVYVQ